MMGLSQALRKITPPFPEAADIQGLVGQMGVVVGHLYKATPAPESSRGFAEASAAAPLWFNISLRPTLLSLHFAGVAPKRFPQ